MLQITSLASHTMPNRVSVLFFPLPYYRKYTDVLKITRKIFRGIHSFLKVKFLDHEEIFTFSYI